MTTLPSPPLSPVDAPYTSLKPMASPARRGHRQEHHRHPERRRDTFELLQALVIEHQRLEQQEYEAMVRDAPAISCRTPAKAPKGILINSSDNKQQIAAPQLLPWTETTKKDEMTPNSSPTTSCDNNHSCPTIPSNSSISTLPRSSMSRIAFALPPPPTTIPLSPPHSSSSTPSPLSSTPSNILISSSSSSSSSSSRAPRHSVVRFSPGPPKIYRYPKLPRQQEI